MAIESEFVKDLMPHQLEALDKMHNGCILRGGTGSGKSWTALAYFVVWILKDFTEIKDLYIITTAKKRDGLEWEKDMAHFLLSTEPGTSNAGVNVTVDSWNNIGRYVDAKDAFFIFDEQRLVGSGAWVKSFYKIAKRNEWILLTATPGDTWLDYLPVFIANGYYRNKTAFVEQHVEYDHFAKFPKVKRYHNQGKLTKYQRQTVVEMPFERHTEMHDVVLGVSYDVELFDKVKKGRWDIYNEQPCKTLARYFSVMRRVVNSDPSRLETIISLLSLHPRMIVFYNFDYELDILRGLQSLTEVSEWNGHKHEEIPTGESWVYLVQTTAGSEGWNCISTDTVVFYSAHYSYRVITQCKGRINRLNTPFTDLFAYHLRSKSWIDIMIKRAYDAKKTFNEASHRGDFA